MNVNCLGQNGEHRAPTLASVGRFVFQKCTGDLGDPPTQPSICLSETTASLAIDRWTQNLKSFYLSLRYEGVPEVMDGYPSSLSCEQSQLVETTRPREHTVNDSTYK